MSPATSKTGHMQTAARLFASAVILGIAGAVFLGLFPSEQSYPGLDRPARLVQQGLDFLDVEPSTPFDIDSAVERFEEALADPEAAPETRDLASFLTGWTAMAGPAPDFDMARSLLDRHLSAFHDSPHRTEALYLHALAALHDPVAPDYAGAVKKLEQVWHEAPGSPLAPLAAIGLAECYLHQLDDPATAAAWHERAFGAPHPLFTTDERLGFLYIAAKLHQAGGNTEAAAALYLRILKEGRGGTGAWTDRVLDRLDELGVEPEGTYFAGLDTTPLPVSEHRFEAESPVEISVSFWILEKPGMRRGIEEIARRYEERTPGVKIRLVDLPYTGYHDWLQSQLLGREIPDIVMIDNGSAIRYGAYQGKLIDLTPHLSADNPYTGMRWADMYYPQFILNARDPVYRRNWIVSWASENTAYFYNKDAFRRAGIVQRDEAGNPLRDARGREQVQEPATWNELMAAFERLRELGMYGEVTNYHPDPAPIIWQLPYYRKQLYDDLIARYDIHTPDDYPDPFELAEAVLSGHLDLRSPELAEPWRLLYEKSQHWVPGATSLDIQQAFEAFASGKAATLFWVSTDMASFEEMCDFELGVFPFPMLSDSPHFDGPYSEEFSLSAFEFAVPVNTRDRGALDAAMDFMMYFTAPEAQEILSREAVCMSPIRWVPSPEKLEPFLTRMNRRGTHMIWFDPYTIGIVKEPYWADSRDKLWNEMSSLLGSMPNQAYYEQITGGTADEYEAWREEAFQQFLQGIQDYFVFAYQRVVREYPDDVRRELKRANNRWISAFRSLHAPPEGDPPAETAELDTEMAGYWRSISDNWGVITRCREIVGPDASADTRARMPMSYRDQKRVGLVLRGALVLLALTAALLLLWRGVFARILADGHILVVFVPTLLLLGVFSYTPALSAIYHAFFLWNGSDISEFIGLGNFEAMMRDEVLGNAIQVMLVFLVANCVKLLPTVLVAVVLFHLASSRAQYLFRVLFILPMAIPGMVGVLIWKYFYRMDGGVLNTVLLNMNVIRAPVNWLGTEETVVPALLFIGFPWVSTIGVLILLAGLQNIDQSVFEAALMDGCGVWRRFWNIEMPLVAGQIKLNVVLITIGTIQDFWLPLVLTRGGPNQASMLPGLWMYQSAFSHGKMGYAAALGVAMFLVILTLTWLNMRFISADRTR